MTCRHKHSANCAGFTMIETIVALGVLGMFFTSVAFILQSVLENVGSSRVRTTATALASQKMEIIRNLPYADVGTIHGIPQGPINQIETVTINGQTFTVNTSIIYIDDQFDTVAPNDIINTDYKRVRVEITWQGVYPSRTPVVLVTNIAPKGVETTAGGGTLLIQVFNAAGQPVSGATITIDNTVVNPAIHMQTLTNADGLVVIPGAPICITCYQIAATKTGYSTDKTYAAAQVANPILPDATVIEGSLTQLSFAIDEVSTLIVNSVNQQYQPISNVMFTLRGNKIIGHDTSDNPVYKYSYSTNTGGGTVSIPSLEWDSYTLDFTNSAHTLAGSNPTLPFVLSPKTTMSIPIVAVPKSNNSLRVTVKDSTGMLKASASAMLTSTPVGYALTLITPATQSADYGQVYFGNLLPASYDLFVSLPGYTEATASVSISTNQEETVTLNTIP